MSDERTDRQGEPARDEVGEALWNLYRGITSPYGEDWDLPLERARYMLIRLGYDPDKWDPPRRP